MKHACSEHTTTEITKVQKGDVQPNAVDLRLGRVWKIGSDEFTITNDSKKHRSSVEVEVRPDGFYHLEVGNYDVTMENEITVGDGEAGYVITRSSLNRNNVTITSGLYDSKYNGVLGCVLHVGSGKMRIEAGTRIGQYIMWDSEVIGEGYSGDYGIGGKHDQKYK